MRLECVINFYAYLMIKKEKKNPNDNYFTFEVK